jgi:hypothetical protein
MFRFPQLGLIAAASFALAACVSSTATKKHASPDEFKDTPQRAVSTVVVDPEALQEATNACAERLHDICGAMFEYYIANHRMPGNLRELGAFSDEPLVFACPETGQDYVYRPISLEGSADHPQLILYDRNPVHKGRRYGIVGAPAEGDRPITMWVVPFNDIQMAEYLRPVQTSAIQRPVNDLQRVDTPAATQPELVPVK